MTRDAELQAIESHMEAHGVCQCRMGEMYYDDCGPSFRERMANVAKNGKKARVKKIRATKARIEKTCGVCGAGFSVIPSASSQKYCGFKCAGIGLGAKRITSVRVDCEYCGKTHTRLQSQMKRKHFFCSPQCSNQFQAGRKIVGVRGKEAKIDGVTYPSIAAATRALGISRDKVLGMLNSGSAMR